ncbi:hypothetical protein J6590_019251 [Homalodisca vitripennis]|nr:hypothetical protein J6590_019251 [Homalodisca vitripennis]
MEFVENLFTSVAVSALSDVLQHVFLREIRKIIEYYWGKNQPSAQIGPIKCLNNELYSMEKFPYTGPHKRLSVVFKELKVPEIILEEDGEEDEESLAEYRRRVYKEAGKFTKTHMRLRDTVFPKLKIRTIQEGDEAHAASLEELKYRKTSKEIPKKKSSRTVEKCRPRPVWR